MSPVASPPASPPVDLPPAAPPAPPTAVHGLSILIVEDDLAHARALVDALTASGHRVETAATGAAALERLEAPGAGGFELVVTDLRLHGKTEGDFDGMEIVARCKAARGGRETPQCVVITGYGSVEGAVKAMQAGALTYLQKPLDVGILRQTVRSAAERIALERSNRELRTTLDKSFAFPGILGQTPAMQRVFDVLNQVSDTDATVLVLGESGTGKELVAQALHREGPRRLQPFVPLNCAALAEGVLESELFGHERGAFTGAVSRRKGRFEAAHGGTLFLDEVGDMPLTTQAKVLRALESGEVVRVGSNEPVRANVRVIAATNRDLAAAVREGTFREDLYFRLRVVTIDLPPLRERLADLPALCEHFLRAAASRHGRPARSLSKEALDLLTLYRWPGNVRELKNVIEAMVLMGKDPVLGEETVPVYVRETRRQDPAGGDDPLRSLAGVRLDDVEKTLVQRTLKDVGGNRERAAKLLGISVRTLYRKLSEYGETAESAGAAGGESKPPA
jgi:two-component system response regulator HydG